MQKLFHYKGHNIVLLATVRFYVTLTTTTIMQLQGYIGNLVSIVGLDCSLTLNFIKNTLYS